MTRNGMPPVHPGEVLLEEFMKPSDPPLNTNALARALEVPANRITAIIKGQRGITGDTAVRLAMFFDTTAEFWMNLQKTYELRLAEQALPVKVRRHIQQCKEALVTDRRADISLGLPSIITQLISLSFVHYSTTLPERQESKLRDSPSHPPQN